MSTPDLPPFLSTSSALIPLKGPSNLFHWNHFLRVELEAFGLAEYVFGPVDAVPEPNWETAPEEHKAWRLARAKASRILHSTLKDEEVMDRLRPLGVWEWWFEDPFEVHDLVMDTFRWEAAFPEQAEEESRRRQARIRNPDYGL